MTDAFDVCIPFVLKEEGGYCCLAGDPGGATCRGVTLATLAAWRGCAVTAKDVEHLTEDEARKIYRKNYWNAVRGDDLPPAVAIVMLDSAVNSGPKQAIRWLQSAVGVERDGDLGPHTLAAVKDHDPQLVAHEVCRLRLAMLRSLSTWSLFKGGWSSRIARLRTAVDQFA
jgi:lysozyme family protein